MYSGTRENNKIEVQTVLLDTLYITIVVPTWLADSSLRFPPGAGPFTRSPLWRNVKSKTFLKAAGYFNFISPDLDPVGLDDDGVVGAGGSAGVGEGPEVGEEGGDRVETQESHHQEPHRHHWLKRSHF